MRFLGIVDELSAVGLQLNQIERGLVEAVRFKHFINCFLFVRTVVSLFCVQPALYSL